MDTIHRHEKLLNMILVAIGNSGIAVLRFFLRRHITDLGI